MNTEFVDQLITETGSSEAVYFANSSHTENAAAESELDWNISPFA